VQTIAEILEKLDVQAVVCFWLLLPPLLLLLHVMLVSDNTRVLKIKHQTV
jgi:hypothetical protein